MIQSTLSGRVLTSALLIAALTASAFAAPDAYVSTELAFPGGPGYQELSAAPFALSVSGSWTSDPGIIGSGSSFSSIPAGKLGGTIDLDTLDYLGSNNQLMLSEAELRETITATGSGTDLKEYFFTVQSTATFALSSSNGRRQYAEFSTRFSAFNISMGNAGETARYLYEYNNGGWNQYLDEGDAEVHDFGTHENYNVTITASVMARPGDRIGIYGDVYGYLESRKSHPSIDFSHTAKISVLAPEGYGFTSTSGVFLSTVPEPGTWTVLGLGMAAFARRRVSRPRP